MQSLEEICLLFNVTDGRIWFFSCDRLTISRKLLVNFAKFSSNRSTIFTFFFFSCDNQINQWLFSSGWLTKFVIFFSYIANFVDFILEANQLICWRNTWSFLRVNANEFRDSFFRDRLTGFAIICRAWIAIFPAVNRRNLRFFPHPTEIVQVSFRDRLTNLTIFYIIFIRETKFAIFSRDHFPFYIRSIASFQIFFASYCKLYN